MKRRNSGDDAVMDYQDGCFFADDFEEADLIEARIRETISMERDLASYLRALGVPGARVIITALEEPPVIDIAGLELTAEEASELITRLDPKWNGYSCDRSWDGLPTDDTLELCRQREADAKKKQERKERQQQEEAERKRHEEEETSRRESEALAAKREERRRRRAEEAVRRAVSPPPIAAARGSDNPSTTQQQNVAAAIAAMRASQKRK